MEVGRRGEVVTSSTSIRSELQWPPKMKHSLLAVSAFIRSRTVEAKGCGES